MAVWLSGRQAVSQKPGRGQAQNDARPFEGEEHQVGDLTQLAAHSLTRQNDEQHDHGNRAGTSRRAPPGAQSGNSSATFRHQPWHARSVVLAQPDG